MRCFPSGAHHIADIDENTSSSYTQFCTPFTMKVPLVSLLVVPSVVTATGGWVLDAFFSKILLLRTNAFKAKRTGSSEYQKIKQRKISQNRKRKRKRKKKKEKRKKKKEKKKRKRKKEKQKPQIGHPGTTGIHIGG